MQSTGQLLLSFTRGGWTNPAGLPRSELQRVSYVLENGALIREYQVELDATPNDPMVRKLLIDHVKNLSVRFMDGGGNWRSDWPPNTLGGGPTNESLRVRPVAVEVSLELEDWGVLVRHIEVAG
jgi:general secretion pathway protein J